MTYNEKLEYEKMAKLWQTNRQLWYKIIMAKAKKNAQATK